MFNYFNFLDEILFFKDDFNCYGMYLSLKIIYLWPKKLGVQRLTGDGG